MSFELFVERYEGQRTVCLPVAAFDEVFRPHIVGNGSEDGYWNVRAPDGSEGELYATVEPRSFNDLWITHFEPGVADLLIEFAKQANGVIFSSFGPQLLVAEEQREQLPEERQGDAVVIRDSEDIDRVLSGWWDDHAE